MNDSLIAALQYVIYKKIWTNLNALATIKIFRWFIFHWIILFYFLPG